jgi:two-component system chemotaxis response regulator CheY
MNSSLNSVRSDRGFNGNLLPRDYGVSQQQIHRFRRTTLSPTAPVLLRRGRREPRRLHLMAGRQALSANRVEFQEVSQPLRSSRAELRSVLIVDSYLDEAEMYAEYLRSLGALVHCVRTPEEAMPLLTSDPPVVIVADMVFRGSKYDGPAFMRVVRSMPACARTNCIIVSGYPRLADRERARAAGADLYLVKPCPPDVLRRHIARAVSAHDRNQRAEWNWTDEPR